MTAGARVLTLALAGTLSALAAWRITAHTFADALAEAEPRAALWWIPGHPQARLVLARELLDQGHLQEARASAEELLEREPLQGDAWAILGDVASARGEREEALSDYAHALRLSPQNAAARLRIIDDNLARGEYETALGHIDRLLRTTPSLRDSVLTALAQLAADPELREALVTTLASAPPWRDAFLRPLHHSVEPEIANAILAGLKSKGALTREESTRWIESLMAHGDWSQAYARWASTLPAPAALPLIYNGRFTQPPTGTGFDWRTPQIVGASVEIEPGAGAKIHFRERRISRAGLEQALFLGPGSYRLTATMRPQGLTAERGLEWVVSCATNGSVAGHTPPIKGTSAWQPVEAQIRIPQGCEGQWLRLQNATRAPALQNVSGTIEIRQVTMERSINR